MRERRRRRRRRWRWRRSKLLLPLFIIAARGPVGGLEGLASWPGPAAMTDAAAVACAHSFLSKLAKATRVSVSVPRPLKRKPAASSSATARRGKPASSRASPERKASRKTMAEL
eukprot:5870269-Pyramimonas_sp.AAC.1